MAAARGPSLTNPAATPHESGGDVFSSAVPKNAPNEEASATSRALGPGFQAPGCQSGSSSGSSSAAFLAPWGICPQGYDEVSKAASAENGD